MDGFHDLGGMQGFGKVDHFINTKSYKPVFKEDWEHLAYSLMFLGAGHLKKFNIDQVRHAVERIDIRQHVGTKYYERYIIATATLLTEAGVITQEELDQELGSYFKLANPQHSNGRSARVENIGFELGEVVLVRDERVSGHIRVPSYVRGKKGIVRHKTTEKWPFPDAIGHADTSAKYEPTYHVEFNIKDLWPDLQEGGFVVVDLFESYLDKV
ncbi:nitrile hydratase subunit beta [Acinetobacter nectaris]|uniref:nitrile hydratase subunit beta n=1 Tax=Acinetobacter nectaris TaxID=1219382 RepID=UPI001F027C41|nr:nitrile hydratase subunit beta [Acinetobacter nectaris]MCF8999173.1 nitrile hydratase subunit beta [Acinetobacter nectaris]MCF9026502.1 nitrile hydratase subunit beta [Acinetobacter nectaris]MCF9035382.1 nitrile hydratase subunit beta [Acinetobacter nectaris]